MYGELQEEVIKQPSPRSREKVSFIAQFRLSLVMQIGSISLQFRCFQYVILITTFTVNQNESAFNLRGMFLSFLGKRNF